MPALVQFGQLRFRQKDAALNHHLEQLIRHAVHLVHLDQCIRSRLQLFHQSLELLQRVVMQWMVIKQHGLLVLH